MITSGVGGEGRGKNEDGKGIQESSMEGVRVGQISRLRRVVRGKEEAEITSGRKKIPNLVIR